MDRWAARLSTRVPLWLALAALVLFVVFTATVLPWQASVSSAYTVRAPAPDGSFFYSADDLYAAAQAWGEQGRAAYVRARLSFDVIWALVYGLFLTTALAWLGGRATPLSSRWRRLVLLPVLVVLLDYAENVCTATVMARYPQPTPVLANVATGFTAAKWVLLAGCFVLVAVGAVAAAITLIRHRGAG